MSPTLFWVLLLFIVSVLVVADVSGGGAVALIVSLLFMTVGLLVLRTCVLAFLCYWPSSCCCHCGGGRGVAVVFTVLMDGHCSIAVVIFFPVP